MAASRDARNIDRVPRGGVAYRSGTRALETLLRSELELRFSETPAMLHAVDEAGFLIAVSDPWLAKLGHNREDVIGRPLADFLAEAAPLDGCEGAPVRLVKKSGEIVEALMSASPACGGWIAVIADITPLMQALRQLRESEASYRCLVEEQSELVSLCSPDGVLRRVNGAYAQFYGGQTEEMIGRNLLDFVPEDQRQFVVEHLQRVCATRDKIESENLVVRPDGRRRWFSWTNRALPETAEGTVLIHSVGRDVQSRVDAEQRLQLSETRYRFLAENSSDLILLVERSGRRLYASPASQKLFGYAPEELIARRLSDDIHPDDSERVFAGLAARGDTLLSYRMRHRAGHYVWVETTGRNVELASGERQRLVIVRDIDQRIAAEERLKASEARYRLLADNSTDVVMALDRNLTRTYVSPSSFEMFGYRPEELVGARTGGAAHPEDAEKLNLGLQALLDGRSDKYVGLTRRRHRDGRWVWTETCYCAVGEGGEITGIVATVRDVTARKAVEDQLAEANRRLQVLAEQDALTGLANRRAFDAALSREHERARQEGGGLALIIFDVDHFKAFNDLYGHLAGDECLRGIAEAIAKAVRKSDIAARYGGEEFAVVLPATDEPDALAIAERVQQVVLQLGAVHGASQQGVVTISAGVAAFGPGELADAPEALVREADRALYLAKNGGRNRVVLACSRPVAA